MRYYGKDICTMDILVKELFGNSAQYADKQISISGWIRTLRASNAFGFIEVNDGTFFKNVQVVFESENLPGNDRLVKQL